MSWLHAYTAAGFGRGNQRTFNPTYAWYLTLLLGYKLSKSTALSVTLPATIELTDSDTTTTNQELWFFDTTVDLNHSFDYEIDSKRGLLFTGTLGAVLPTSKDSRAATMIFGPRAAIGGIYSDKRVLDKLSAGVNLSYVRRLNVSNVPLLVAHIPCDQVGSALHECASPGELSSKRDWIVLDLSAGLDFGKKWSASASLTFWWYLAYRLSTESLMIDTGPVTVGDTSATHWRNVRWLVLSLGYKITPWMTVSARMIDAFSELGPDGHERAPLNPFDTLYGLGVNVSFDKLYLSTRTHAPAQR